MVLAAYDSTGSTVVSVGPRDNIFKAWDVTDNTLSHSHTQTVAYTSIAIGSTAKSASGSQEGAKKKKKATSSDKPILVFGCQNGGVQIWDLESLKKISEASPFKNPVTHVVVHPTRKSIFACAGETGQVVEIGIVDGKQVDSFEADKSNVSAMCLSPDGQFLVTAGVSKIRVWSLFESPIRCVGKFVPPLNVVKHLSINSDNKYVSASDDSTSVHLYGLQKIEGKKVSAAVVINAHERIVSTFHAPKQDKLPKTIYAITADGNVLAYAIRNGKASLISTISAGKGKVPSRIEAVFALHAVSANSLQVARGVTSGPTFVMVDLRQDGEVLGAPDRLKDVTLPTVAETTTNDKAETGSNDVEMKSTSVKPAKVLGAATIGQVKPSSKSKVSTKQISTGLEFSDSPENLQEDEKLRKLVKSLPRLNAQPIPFESVQKSVADLTTLVNKIVALPDYKEGEHIMKLLVTSDKTLTHYLIKKLDSATVANLLRKMLLAKEKHLPLLNERIMLFFREATREHGSNLVSNDALMDNVDPGLKNLKPQIEAYDKLLLLQGKVDFLKHLTNAQKAGVADIDDNDLSEEESDEEGSAESSSGEDSDSSEKDDADHDFDDVK
eukprot:gene10-776_t